jgi:hypothetical protein
MWEESSWKTRRRRGVPCLTTLQNVIDLLFLDLGDLVMHHTISVMGGFSGQKLQFTRPSICCVPL